MRNKQILSLLLMLVGYIGIGTVPSYGVGTQVSCGCHLAPTCAQCGTQPYLCNGDCTWEGSKCISKKDFHWSPQQPKVWLDHECPNLSNEPIGQTVKTCKERCEKKPRCTAINFDPLNGGCTLRGCKLPVPAPVGISDDIVGYYMIIGDENQYGLEEAVTTQCSNNGPNLLYCTVCEHALVNGVSGNGKLNLNCPSGNIQINSTLYGRQDLTTCKPVGQVNPSCSSTTALSKVEALCNGRQSCTLTASNGNFGDPCLGTRKYLTVGYTCQE